MPGRSSTPIVRGAKASSAVPQAAASRGRVTFSSGRKIPYYRTHPLNTANSALTTAIVVVHGNSRNADDYFDRAIAAVDLENRLADTLVLAPHFQAIDDGPASDEHFWSEGGWKQGSRSKESDDNRLSSFAVMDQIFTKICEGFPTIDRVVLIGHSAGGQFVNRYCAAGIGAVRAGAAKVHVSMNPGSYLYLDSRRRAGSRFVTPASGSCPGFNDYKYGLDDLDSVGYLAAVGESKLCSNMFRRRAIYLAGDQDTGSQDLDTGCEANLQGKHRLHRARSYAKYIETFSEWKLNAEFREVRGVGHSSSSMFLSKRARDAMFRA